MRTQMRTMPREMSEVDRVGDAPPPAASWRTLDRAAGVAALITAVLVPIQLAVFVAYPFPDTVTGWFELLQDNPLAGLVSLDLLLVLDNLLLMVIALALYVALRRTSPSVTTMATGLWVLAIAMFIAANLPSRCSRSAAGSRPRPRRLSERWPWPPARPCWPAGRAPPSTSAMSWGSSPGS